SYRLARDCMKSSRPDVVAKRSPGLRDLLLGCTRERLERRVPGEPFVILRHDAIDLRLLQHHFGYENVIRVAGPSPRQGPCVAALPGEKHAPEALASFG